jgi:hypothetical protein
LLKEVLVNEIGLVPAKTAMSWDAYCDSILSNGESPVGQLAEHECPTIGIRFRIFGSVLNDDGATTRFEFVGHGPKPLATGVVQFRGS